MNKLMFAALTISILFCEVASAMQDPEDKRVIYLNMSKQKHPKDFEGFNNDTFIAYLKTLKGKKIATFDIRGWPELDDFWTLEKAAKIIQCEGLEINIIEVTWDNMHHLPGGFVQSAESHLKKNVW